MSMLVDILNAIAILLFLYPFAIYPGLLYVLARRKSKDASADAAQESLPSLALVICALNEEKIIRQKMENCLALRYPQEKLRIVVISDGSTDATAAIVREYQDKGIELIDQPRRRGKIANLNAVLPARTEDILALSDANVLYAPDALLHLAERFQDPTSRMRIGPGDPDRVGSGTRPTHVQLLFGRMAAAGAGFLDLRHGGG